MPAQRPEPATEKRRCQPPKIHEPLAPKSANEQHSASRRGEEYKKMRASFISRRLDLLNGLLPLPPDVERLEQTQTPRLRILDRRLPSVPLSSLPRANGLEHGTLCAGLGVRDGERRVGGGAGRRERLGERAGEKNTVEDRMGRRFSSD